MALTTNIKFYSYTGDMRKVDKSIGNFLYQCDAYLNTSCDILTPEFSIGYSDTAVQSYNYAYIDAWKRYYYITDWRTDSGGKLNVKLSIDVLKTYASQILASDVNVVRNENVGMTHVVDDKYPLYQELNDVDIKILTNGAKPLLKTTDYTILLGVM